MVHINGTSTSKAHSNNLATNNLKQIPACSCSSKKTTNKDKTKNKDDGLRASSVWPRMIYFMEEANVMGTT